MLLTFRWLILTASICLFSLEQGLAQKTYEEFEEAIQEQETIAKAALMKGKSKAIAKAHYNLVNTRLKARTFDFHCDFGYSSDLIQEMQIVVDHSPYFQKILNSLPVYKELSNLFQMRLMGLGFITKNPLSLIQLQAHLKSIIESRNPSNLFMPQPGVYPLGHLEFKSSMVTVYNGVFDDQGNFSVKAEKAVSASVTMNPSGNGIILKLENNNKEAYLIRVRRNDTFITQGIVPDDEIIINGLDENGAIDEINPENRLEIAPDECSA